jgi:hypothetical protein
MGNSLYQQDNVTFTGNTTLTGVSNGLHQMKVYANHTVGNMGAYELIKFTEAQVTEPKPFPTSLVLTASV